MRWSLNHFLILTFLFIIYTEASFGQVVPSTSLSTSTSSSSLLQIAFNFLAGLVLFLFGITKLSRGFKSLAGRRMNSILSKFTGNPLAGLLTGFVATAILDSSSIVIIMIIALVNAGVLNSAKSLAVVLGANVGTTVSSQIIAFDIASYSPIAMFIGFVMYSLSSTRKMKRIGLIVFAAGLIFFGLKVMGESMSPLKDDILFNEWMNDIENPLLGVLVGAVFTIVIQSSSATLGVVITMANQGMVTLAAGIALMIGAELGTCADTLVASIGRTREAVKVTIFHLVFNIVSVIIGLILFQPFLEFVVLISFQDVLSHQVANAHFLFNMIGALMLIGFTSQISSLLNKIIPEKMSGSRHLDDSKDININKKNIEEWK